MPTEWTDAELDLLSAYIDEQLDDSERTALEARLAKDADLRQELAAMRQTVALLHSLPTIRAPRAFTLTPDMVGQTAVPVMAMAQSRAVESKVRPMRRVWWIPAASAAGVVLLAGFVLLTQTNMGNTPTMSSVALQQTSTAPTSIPAGSALNTVVRDIVLVPTATILTVQSTSLQPEPVTVQESAIQLTQPLPETEVVVQSEEADDAEDSEADGAAGAPIMPPVSATQDLEQQASAPAMQPQEIVPRQSPSATSDPLNDYQADNSYEAPADPSLSMQSGGGGTGTIPIIGGMTGVNPNPEAPGFSVATMSPPQGTEVALYRTTDEVAVFALPPATSAKREPVWIRWFNTLAEWIQSLLARN